MHNMQHFSRKNNDFCMELSVYDFEAITTVAMTVPYVVLETTGNHNCWAGNGKGGDGKVRQSKITYSYI